MLKRYLSLLFLGAITQSCSAEISNNHSIDFFIGKGAKLFFSSHYSDDQNLMSREDFPTLMSLEWYAPYDVKDEKGDT